MAAEDDEPGVFCTRCFASDRDSSWGDPAASDHCFNCGAGGCTVPIPGWAIKFIRESASWVGKRYYPSQEDREQALELRYLRSLVPPPPGRTVKRADYDVIHEHDWVVKQEYPDGSSITTTVRADCDEQARLAGQIALPYPVPKAFSKANTDN